MTATLIDGKAIAANIKAEVAEEVNALLANGIEPCLATVLVGDDPDSHTYIGAKHKACEKVGIKPVQHQLADDISEKALLDLVDVLNQDESVHGILVQLPLPEHISDTKVIEAIDPHKDVDGFHPYNVGRLSAGLDTLISCTPYGVSELLVRSGVDTCGKHVVIVGRSNIVGKPLLNLLSQKSRHGNATVTICHSKTNDLKNHTLQADILVTAMGQAQFITADMVKPGVVVIDVGINGIEEEGKFRLVGDVDFEQVKQVASKITPVPGGVGPMTIAMLMHNVAKAAHQAQQV